MVIEGMAAALHARSQAAFTASYVI